MQKVEMIELGKEYRKWFWIFVLLWALLAFIDYPPPVAETTGFAFSILVFFLVILQLTSGVALDRFWVASISAKENKLVYWGVVIGQLCIGFYVGYASLNI